VSVVPRLGGIFDYDLKVERLEEVLRELEDPAIWNDAPRAQTMAKEKASWKVSSTFFVTSRRKSMMRKPCWIGGRS